MSRDKVELEAAKTTCEAGFTEQDWIDALIGHADTVRRTALHLHAAECASCQALREEWGQLLSPTTGKNDGAPEAYELTPSRRASLRRRVRLKGAGRWLGRSLLAGSAAVAAVILVAMLMSQDRLTSASDEHLLSYVESQEPAALQLVRASDTSRYRIAPQGEAREGYLWLSGDSREAFLLLDPLARQDGEDYQAWAIQGARRYSLGIVKFAGGAGYLHMKTDLLPYADHIALSTEPKGGSETPSQQRFMLLVPGP
ncbi:anti-sigma factor [Paenibacillus sp. PL2-23]|uniref:anti-sigma factor domain-containing protein n=1 Tax=Paenibacillus sp. PL2-23 TaxID=2100729 RepID=UPI0030F8697A